MGQHSAICSPPQNMGKGGCVALSQTQTPNKALLITGIHIDRQNFIKEYIFLIHIMLTVVLQCILFFLTIKTKNRPAKSLYKSQQRHIQASLDRLYKYLETAKLSSVNMSLKTVPKYVCPKGQNTTLCRKVAPLMIAIAVSSGVAGGTISSKSCKPYLLNCPTAFSVPETNDKMMLSKRH